MLVNRIESIKFQCKFNSHKFRHNVLHTHVNNIYLLDIFQKHNRMCDALAVYFCTLYM